LRAAKKSSAPVKRALVTGGAGFLGSHLCERLLDLGREVVCLDNFQTGSASNVAHLTRLASFSIVNRDVTAALSFEVDEIYNLACPASPLQYQKDPVQTLKTSVLGAINVLDLGRERGARVFQASTSEVYGDAAVHPQIEGYWGNVNSFGPRACYDEGKRCAETLFHDYHERHGVDIRIARIFNTYGPRMSRDDGRVVANFIVQALTGQDLTIYGDGTQTRSFCFVDDLIDGFVQLMNTDTAPSSPVNLGNPVEITIRELADLIVALSGSGSAIVHRPLPVDDPRQRCPDISLAQKTIGWTPKVQAIEGLARTISYFDGLLSNNGIRDMVS
jgi:UDP-glucuronate decarboxylase